MNDGFMRGFIKAAMSVGLSTGEALDLYKAAGPGTSMSPATPSMGASGAGGMPKPPAGGVGSMSMPTSMSPKDTGGSIAGGMLDGIKGLGQSFKNEVAPQQAQMYDQATQGITRNLIPGLQGAAETFGQQGGQALGGATQDLSEGLKQILGARQGMMTNSLGAASQAAPGIAKNIGQGLSGMIPGLGGAGTNLVDMAESAKQTESTSGDLIMQLLEGLKGGFGSGIDTNGFEGLGNNLQSHGVQGL